MIWPLDSRFGHWSQDLATGARIRPLKPRSGLCSQDQASGAKIWPLEPRSGLQSKDLASRAHIWSQELRSSLRSPHMGSGANIMSLNYSFTPGILTLRLNLGFMRPTSCILKLTPSILRPTGITMPKVLHN